jgi:hypothetical protein
MQYLQKFFLFFLNPVSRIMVDINSKIKKMLITVNCFCLVGYFLLYFNPIYKIRFKLTYDHMICSIFLLGIILFSIDRELKTVKWNILVAYTFFLSGLGILVISFIHPVGSGYRAFALLMMFGFPCLYFVWNNRGDYRTLYTRLSAATSILGVLYYFYCFFLAGKGLIKIEDNRVASNFYDANMFSMIGMIMVCASLYMLLVNRGSWAWFAISDLSIATGLTILKLAVSRLSILAVLGGLIAFTCFYCKTQSDFKEANRNAIKYLRALLLLITIVITFASGHLMLMINSNAVEKQAQVESSRIIDETETSTKSETEELSEPVPVDSVDVIDRFNVEGKDLDAYTAGRYHIWKGYAQFLNMTGNDFSKADWYALTWNTVKHAHNNFLEIAFRCGIPVACLHVLLELIAGIICIIWLFNPKYREPEYLFCIVFMICYTVQSLFDIATLPFERPAPFYFYMIMIPIFMFGTEEFRSKGMEIEKNNVQRFE